MHNNPNSIYWIRDVLCQLMRFFVTFYLSEEIYVISVYTLNIITTVLFTLEIS